MWAKRFQIIWKYIQLVARFIYKILRHKVWPHIHAYFSGPDHFRRRCFLYSVLGHMALFIYLMFDLSWVSSHKPESQSMDLIQVELITEEELQEPEDIKEEEPIAPLPPQVIRQPQQPAPIPAQPVEEVSDEVTLAQNLDAIPLPPMHNKRLKKPKPRPKPQPKPEPEKVDNLDQFLDRVIHTRDPNPNQPDVAPPPARKALMTGDEQNVLLQTLKKNWDIPPTVDGMNITVTVRITVSKDRQVKSIKVLSITGEATASLKKTMRISVERAIKKSSPLPVPADKYYDWKQIEISFNPIFF